MRMLAGAGEKEEHEKFQAFTNAQQEKGDGAGRKQKAKLESLSYGSNYIGPQAFQPATHTSCLLVYPLHLGRHFKSGLSQKRGLLGKKTFRITEET